MLKIFMIALAVSIAAVNSFAQPARRYTPHKASAVRVGPTTTYLKNGLTTQEVVRLLGQPLSISEHQDNKTTVVVYEFARSEGRILVAEFVNNALTSSRVETRNQLAKATR